MQITFEIRAADIYVKIHNTFDNRAADDYVKFITPSIIERPLTSLKCWLPLKSGRPPTRLKMVFTFKIRAADPLGENAKYPWN